MTGQGPARAVDPRGARRRPPSRLRHHRRPAGPQRRRLRPPRGHGVPGPPPAGDAGAWSRARGPTPAAAGAGSTRLERERRGRAVPTPRTSGRSFRVRRRRRAGVVGMIESATSTSSCSALRGGPSTCAASWPRPRSTCAMPPPTASRAGLPPDEAEGRAIARFGSPRAVARRFAAAGRWLPVPPWRRWPPRSCSCWRSACWPSAPAACCRWRSERHSATASWPPTCPASPTPPPGAGTSRSTTPSS